MSTIILHDPTAAIRRALARRRDPAAVLPVSGTWCACGRHRTESPNSRCPVCSDRRR